MTRIRAAFIALLIASVALAAYGDQPTFGPRDPGAARQDLSNVTPATGRSALGLGTMAVEAKTDYVATGTFTGHTDDASDPHGATLTQTTILSDSVDGVDISAHVASAGVHGVAQVANAADYLRLDGTATMTNNLRLGSNWLSNDGGDEGVYVTTDGKAGIGTATPSYLLGLRGASQGSAFSTSSDATWVYQEIAVPATMDASGRGIKFSLGNGTAGAGILGIAANQTGGIFDLAFLTSTGNSHYERMRVTSGGNVLIGTTSDDGTNKLQVSGSILATTLKLSSVPVYADNAAATTGGLAEGQVYRTSAGVLMIRY